MYLVKVTQNQETSKVLEIKRESYDSELIAAACDVIDALSIQWLVFQIEISFERLNLRYVEAHR